MRGVYKVKRSSGTAIYISYTPPGERRVRERFKTVPQGPRFSKRLATAQREAEKELTSRLAACNEGRHHLVAEAKRKGSTRALTFGEYAEKFYIPAMKAGTNSARERMKDSSLHREVQRCSSAGTLGRYFHGASLEKITRSEVERFIEHRIGEGAGAPGVNRDLARLRNLLNDAAEREELGLALPKIAWTKLRQREEPESYRPMRDDEEPRIMAELRDRTVRDLVEFLVHTGMRPQAAMALRWEHVDLDRMVIHVPKDINKTAAYRVYPNSRVQESLRALYAWRPERLRQPTAEVFCHRNGKRRRSIRTAWERARKAAEVEGLHVRGLRATAATRIQEAGGSELDVKLHLGHAVSSMGVTGRYIDPHEDSRRRVAELTLRARSEKVIPLQRLKTSASAIA